MERDLYDGVVAALSELGRPLVTSSSYGPRRFKFSDALIAAVYFWSAINDRPRCWACRQDNWPASRRPTRLPSQSQLSRRLGAPGVISLIKTLDARVRGVEGVVEREPLISFIDGKALPVAAHSRDRDATWGRGVGGKARGFKAHVRAGPDGRILDWAVMPLNVDERTMAEEMLRRTPAIGYVAADKNYDSNKLHQCVTQSGAQLIVPRRYGSNKGLGHRKHDPGRLRSRDLLENTVSNFGRELHALRGGIERVFGYLTCTAGLLTHLPAWVRTLPRVRLWVAAKIILSQIRKTCRKAAAVLDG